VTRRVMLLLVFVTFGTANDRGDPARDAFDELEDDNGAVVDLLVQPHPPPVPIKYATE
jgi:hypothetical protein